MTSLVALCRKAVQKFGPKNQVLIAVEEMQELGKALLKWRRYVDSDPKKAGEAADNVLEEMEDVRIMLIQLMEIFGSSSEWRQIKFRHMVEITGEEPGPGRPAERPET